MKIDVRKSFGSRLIKLVMLIVGIFFLAVTVIVGVISHRLLYDESVKSSKFLLGSNIAEVEKVLLSVENSARHEASVVFGSVVDVDDMSDVGAEESEMLYFITGNTVGGNPLVVGSAVAFANGAFAGRHFFSPYSYRDESGEISRTQLGTASYDYFYMDWYQIPALLGTPVWSEPYYDEGGGGTLMTTYSYPVKNSAGEVCCVVTADLSFRSITEAMGEICPYKGSSTFLVSRGGVYMSGEENSLLGGETIYSVAYQMKDPAVYDICADMMAGKEGTGRFRIGATYYFAVYGPLENGWAACTICPYKTVLAGATRMQIILILVSLFGMLVIFLVIHFAVHRVTRPITEFSDSALSIAGGNFETALPQISTEDEIGRLRDSFQTMQESLVTYVSNLRESTALRQKMESELNIANQIQQAMLPKDFLEEPDIKLYAVLNPAKEVGGDFYDFFRSGDYRYFAIGDVSGKGVPAALFMAITKSCFRLVAGLNLPLGEAMGRINDFVCNGNDMGMFVTMFMARYNIVTSELEYCNAGHNPVVMMRNGGHAEFLKAKTNVAVGVMEGFPYVAESIHISGRTRFVLYTDGITEAEDPDKNQYGEQRLLEWCDAGITKGFQSAKAATQDLLESVHTFVRGNDQNDDITVVSVRIL